MGELQNGGMGEWRMGIRPVGRFVVSDEGVATEVKVSAVVARLADHLCSHMTTGSGSHDRHVI